jgi:hypothetical protein
VIEVWGGSLDYDGHDVTNTTTLKTDTVYLGTREEIAATLKYPLAEKLTIGPLAGFGHKFWVRTRSSEDWNTIYGKLGAAIAYSATSCDMFVRSGAAFPLYTRNHASLSSEGYGDVTIEPKSAPAIFAEAGVRLSSWTFSVNYEEMNFGKSDKEAVNQTVQQQNGVAVINSQVYQPKSTSSLLSFKVQFHF